MLRDRGTKKWTAMMLPEHVKELKKSLIEKAKLTKPMLDEQEIELMEVTILEALEKDTPLLFSIFNDGFTKILNGKVLFIDHIKKKFKIMDGAGNMDFISFENIIKIEKRENL